MSRDFDAMIKELENIKFVIERRITYLEVCKAREEEKEKQIKYIKFGGRTEPAVEKTCSGSCGGNCSCNKEDDKVVVEGSSLGDVLREIITILGGEEE